VEIAQKIGGEIISADSRQVYKGMDLGTGKITKKEMRRVPHYMLDVVSPKKTFTVSEFQKLANKKIKEIFKNGKTPIMCGGTGFYIDAVINGTIFPEVPPNKKLREELYRLDAIALGRYLEKLDPQRFETIDKNNKVRLVRAIEIAKALGKVPSLSPGSDLGINKFEVLKIGLTISDEILKERIKSRLLMRIKKGMIKEIENLHKDGVSWKRMNDLGLEYRYASLYLQGKLKKEEMIEKLNTETWHYAKRQKTWFKRDLNTIWINPTKKSEKAKALKEIKRFLIVRQ
jgi:tRNA dimethylallyltransferase